MTSLLGLVPLIAIAAAPWCSILAGRLRMHPGWIAAPVPAGLAILLVSLAAPVWDGQTLRLSVAWFPDLGIRYALTLDGLSLLFGLLIAGVGLLIVLYSVAYMARGPHLGRFYAHMLLFMGAMLGVVLADDLVLLYIFWELTSLASFFLIGYHDEDPGARAGATQALIVTVAGGVAMLAGFVLLAQVGGTWQISGLIAGAIAADGRVPAILLLILAGAFAKSAQIPFQFWLPSAMVAPTPVSTYLHAATMVWAGVYLLARMLPVLGGHVWWTGIVAPVGLATVLVGAGLALTQTHLKALLAYSTVGALGLATALLGSGTPEAVAAAAVLVLNHAAFKGTLFLVAGIVEHETGARELYRLSGLRRGMPITFGLAAVATLSMAGIPPLGGFLSKEVAVEAFLPRSWLAAGIVVLSGALSLAYGARFLQIFFGPRPAVRPGGRRPGAKHAAPETVSAGAHDPTALLWAPAAALALLAPLFGLVPGAVERLAGLATAAVTGAPHSVRLWHGLTVQAVAVTVASVALGAALFGAQDRAQRIREGLPWLSAGRLYDALYAGTLRAASGLTSLYMTGRLRDYLIYITGATVVLIVAGLARTGIAAPLWPQDLQLGPALAVLVAIGAAVAAARLPMLVASILALGVAGYTVGLIYLLLSAPDIAMTQVVIETVSLVLFLVAITALGRSDAGHPPRRPGLDGLTAVAAGAVSAAMAAMVASPSALPRVSEAFFAHAAEAGGRNVVNLVIVDFRGWDTMGEITVLGIAAVGIMALAPWRRRARGVPAPPGRSPGNSGQEAPMTSLILRTVATVASPAIALFALMLWATGHYSPGGGFVAGLMVAAAVALRAQAFGAHLLARRWDRLMAFGLLLAGGSAAVPLVAGKPLLQHTLLTVGSAKFASSLIFDAGVLCLVAGTVLAAVRSLVEAA
ncbi:MAG: proton-conducting transporter membrane subunit [Armatimonadota bacterium]|nr:proton-conducting transporter membrane subunit [Armatimonadota bacterium]MDR7548842.1 proton-conducting transporter membrane subunit [Armatimonadota bacterium]